MFWILTKNFWGNKHCSSTFSGIIDKPKVGKKGHKREKKKTEKIFAKVVLVGCSGAGKSSICFGFVKEEFLDKIPSTIGASYNTKTIEIKNQKIELSVWDTAGQERYHSLVPLYFRKARAVIIVYDITDKSSFIKVKTWVSIINDQAPKGVIKYLVGNKIDLNDERVVKGSDALYFAKEKKMCFIETSAKNLINVNTLFYDLGMMIIEEENDRKKESESVITSLEDPLDLGQKTPEQHVKDINQDYMDTHNGCIFCS